MQDGRITMQDPGKQAASASSVYHHQDEKISPKSEVSFSTKARFWNDLLSYGHWRGWINWTAFITA
ncbi:hypothetical protein EJB05_29033 [Eragrostis curvula]|uniref:Uncharacterized protein n=1 Tax=Eragrostis curvula TaxID=38414 RepID=A0A5J9USX0_9POAL|nr:hypothetical protein EJB05_29033 [Eragrostis curvula]